VGKEEWRGLFLFNMSNSNKEATEMSEISGVVETIYSRFILRDVFAKVVPGAVFLLAVASALTSPAYVSEYASAVSSQ